MEYLKQFITDLKDSKIAIRDCYVDQTHVPTMPPLPIDPTPSAKPIREPKQDVVSDLMERGQAVSVACLPIARQIILSEKQICLKIPKIGDLFVGIVNHPVIEKVTYIISNYREEYIFDGHLEQVGELSLWTPTQIPLLLLVINDYDSIGLSVQIDINSHYNLQNSNHDVFKACYGYFNNVIRQHLTTKVLYEMPLHEPNHMIRIVCGLWREETMVGVENRSIAFES